MAEVCETLAHLLDFAWSGLSWSKKTFLADPYPRAHLCDGTHVLRCWGPVPLLIAQPALSHREIRGTVFLQPISSSIPKPEAQCSLRCAAPCSKSWVRCLWNRTPFLSVSDPFYHIINQKKLLPSFFFFKNEPTQVSVLIHHAFRGTRIQLLVAPSGHRHHTWPQPVPNEVQSSW